MNKQKHYIIFDEHSEQNIKKMKSSINAYLMRKHSIVETARRMERRLYDSDEYVCNGRTAPNGKG